MLRGSVLACGTLFVVCVAVAVAVPVGPAPPPDFSRLKPESIKKWSGAEVLLIGKFTKVDAGPVARSEPPVYSFSLQIAPDKILRGPRNADKQMRAIYSIRQQNAPSFPGPDKDCVIALKFVRKSWIVQDYSEASADAVEQAKMAVSFPLGWSIKDGKLTSPWAVVGKPGKAEGQACSVTGRPVLLAGEIRIDVEPIPPAKSLQFKNPDGDGDYKLTVKNESDQEIEVPALLTDGKTIFWNESVVVRIQDKSYPIPGATGNVAGLRPVVLKAGESVSGTIHALALDGPSWPRGGSRVEFQFCLGERSATHSFYYFSNHHDPIRETVRKNLKEGN